MVRPVGRSRETALIRTQANTKLLNFATKRIIRDLQEIQNETIPTVGVSARPLDKNLFIWHANIQGPKDTIYEGGVFHLELTIPESYPHQAPKIKLLTTFPHPNVFDEYICLDMLDSERKEGRGWSSGYTIQSILIQLQSFLFEKQYEEEEIKYSNKVKQAVKKANDFQCTECKHGGKLSAWPEFQKEEKNEDNFIIHDFDESSQFAKEILCYHTKLSFKDIIQEDKDEPTKGVQLGVGLNVSKVPRTGAIQNAVSTLDYISIKAFVKEGIRQSVNNEKFSHWLPIYFGKEDNKDRAIKLGERALSMIMANNTKRFSPEMILEVYPKIIVTSILYMVDEKRHSSIAIIRILAHMHANLILFMEQYPQLYDEVEKRLQEFIKDESKRVKSVTPNLSALLSYLLVSPKTTFSDVVEAYHSESLDRQIFWILKSVPELIGENEYQPVNQERAKLIFKAQQISYQILCVFKNYIQITRSLKKTPKELLEMFNENHSKFPLKIENEIQVSTKAILSDISSYSSFYKFIGMKEKTVSELNLQMQQAFKNSRAKNYHGKMEEMHKIPTSEEQVKSLIKNIPKTEDLFNVQAKKAAENKNVYDYSITQKKKLSEEEFKKICLQRWSWIGEQLVQKPDITATEVAELSIELLTEGEIKGAGQTSRIYEKIKNEYNEQEILHEKPKISIPEQTWEQVFFKLDLEDTLFYFDKNPDFPIFYEKLEILKDKLDTLSIPIISLQNVKSGYHYLTQLLTKLTGLKYVTITGLPEVQTCFPLKGLKCLQKGFQNFTENQGSLHSITYTNFIASGISAEITDKVFTPMQQMKDLISIKFNKTNLLHQSNATKSFSNIITQLKNLQQLILTGQVMNNQQQAKEIADGLMRAKKLKYFSIANNTLITYNGLGSLIYNLAFAVNLCYLDISSCSQQHGGTIADVVESLYKLLKINASIEILDCSNISTLNQSLSKDFCIYLGETKTLTQINLSNCGALTTSSAGFLGKAVAFNHRKAGVMEFMNLQGAFNSHIILENFYNNMYVSNYDEESWYGDLIKAQKMSGQDLEKTYYNNLRALQLNDCNISSGFNLADFEKHNRKDPAILKLFARSKNLSALQLSNCNLNKRDADLLYLALDPLRLNFASNIKVLDLSKNQLGKEGTKVIAKILEKNNILENLDLSKNQIGVKGAQEIALALKNNKALKFLNVFNNKIGYDGANAFGETLAVNSTLEFLELGHNRIRNKGLLAIADGLAKNIDNSKIQVLGLKFNFLSEDGVIDFLKTVQNNKALKEIYIKNNSISEYGLFQLKKAFDNLGLKQQLFIDLFDKLHYLCEERLERTIFVHPVPGSRSEIKNFFENETKCGIVVEIRLRKGPKWPNRTAKPNYFAMIEFVDPASCIKALNVASTKKAIIRGSNFRIYKAGTGTYIYQKKSANQKQAEKSKTNFVVPTAQDLKKIKR